MNIRLHDVVGFYLLTSILWIGASVVILQSLPLTALTVVATFVSILYLQINDMKRNSTQNAPEVAS